MAGNFSFLSTTGQSNKGFVESASGDNSIVATLQKWGDDTMKQLRVSLNKKTSTGTSKTLEQSIVVLPVQFADTKFILTLQASDYWKFVNKGVKGIGGFNESKQTPFVQKNSTSPFSFKDKRPPSQSLWRWSNTKHLNAFAVSESIFHTGTKATKFFDEVIKPNWSKDLAKKIAKAGSKEIEIVLSTDFKRNK